MYGLRRVLGEYMHGTLLYHAHGTPKNNYVLNSSNKQNFVHY